MLSTVHRTLQYARRNAIAFLALFVALGGTGAYAANTIGSADVIDNSLLSQDIRTGEVKATDIGLDQIISSRIKDGEVMAGDIGANQVLGSRITDGTIKGEDIANNRVTGYDVNESTLEIVPLAATANAVADGAVKTASLFDNAVTTSKVLNDALTGDDIDESTLVGLCTTTNEDCKGPEGDKGDTGDACLPTNPACVGPKGDPGADGEDGEACLPTNPACVGPKGDTGDSYDPSDKLASGDTQTGVYSAWGEKVAADSVQFRPQLAAPIAANHSDFVATWEQPTESCPGPGQAAAGWLCVYESHNISLATTPDIRRPASTQSYPDGYGATSDGFFVWMLINDGVNPYGGSYGTWAVTAP